MVLLEWFTFLAGCFFNVASLLVLFNPQIREPKGLTPILIIEMIFVLTATIVALQAIRT